MAIIIKPFDFIPGTVIRSLEVNQDFDVLYTDYNGNITNPNIAAGAGIAFSKLAALPSAQIIVGSAGNVPTAVAMSGAATISNTGVVSLSGSTGGAMPIGSIIPFYDFNGVATFDTNFWRYCDGSVLVYPASPLNGQSLPDLSGRYLTGFGTPGGGNIDTDPWATAQVGNATNQANLAHTHGPGTLQFEAGMQSTTQYSMFDNVGTPFVVAQDNVVFQAGVNRSGAQISSTNRTYYTRNGTGVTAAGGSATQDIRPSSIRVRYIIRVL